MIKFGVIPLLLMSFSMVAFSSSSVLNSPLNAQDNPQESLSATSEFMTVRDLALATPSNVSIQYTGNSSVTVTGIYIFTLTSNPNDCTTSTLLDGAGEPYGALWSPQVTMTQNQIKSVGANYLYNMMMVFLYEAYVNGATAGNLYTPGNAEDGNNTWCLWLGVTNQTMGTDSLTCSNCNLNTSNILVQYISAADTPVSFTNVTCDDATRLCRTTDLISPQPFPHQGP